MKVYRCTNYYHSTGYAYSWYTSRQEADSARKAYDKDGGDECDPGLSSVEVEDIPTDRKGLIAWLNAKVRGDQS